MNSQTPHQECLPDSYGTDKAKIMLNKRYEELRTQILELGSVGPLGVHKSLNSRPPSSVSATQWWKSGRMVEEFNLIAQQGMVSWLEVWIDLKPMGDTNVDADTGKESAGSPCKILLRQMKENIQSGEPETRKKSNGEGGTRNRGKGENGNMILDCPGALVGVLSDMICNTIDIRNIEV